MVGLRPRLARRGNARAAGQLIFRRAGGIQASSFRSLWNVRGPGLAGFGLNLGETHARGRIGNADEVLAGGTLNLAPGKLRFALQRLITVGTVEFEFRVAHGLHLSMR